MSLNTPKLRTDLKKVYTDTYDTTGNAEAALDAFLEAFTDKLDAWIKTAAIQYTGGLTAGLNPVTGTFNGSIK